MYIHTKMTTQKDASPFKFQRRLSVSTRRLSESVQVIEYDLLRNYPKFKEREDFQTGLLEYERVGTDPGLLLIFNNEKFDDRTMEDRRGTRRDVNEIIICFQRLGFNIDANSIMNDYTTEQIMTKLKEIADKDLSEYNSLIVFFLTHGDEFNRLLTKDGTIRADEIWGEFKRNRSLVNKPKMFILQACKGDGYSTTGTTEAPGISTSPPPKVIAPQSTFSTKYLYGNLLIVYSTVEGTACFRNTLTGSWFIQELCKNFSTYGRRDDVISLVIRTTKCVCANYYHVKDNEKQKQMPFFVTTLRKKFYLNKNKDRDMILQIAKNTNEILEVLKEIKEALIVAK